MLQGGAGPCRVMQQRSCRRRRGRSSRKKKRRRERRYVECSNFTLTLFIFLLLLLLLSLQCNSFINGCRTSANTKQKKGSRKRKQAAIIYNGMTGINMMMAYIKKICVQGSGSRAVPGDLAGGQLRADEVGVLLNAVVGRRRIVGAVLAGLGLLLLLCVG